jgi:hypothetical protein
MFVAFLSLHILLCTEVLLYFILHVEVPRSLNFNLNLYKGEFNVNPTNPFNLIRIKG